MNQIQISLLILAIEPFNSCPHAYDNNALMDACDSLSLFNALYECG